MSEQIYRLAYDPEPLVRSRAVAMLAELPGPTGRRILRVALSDSDARVQANAIEVLDLLDAPDRVAETVLKLKSKNSRVRANAVKSLLRLDVREAATALLEMLEGNSSAQRISALWLIERLKLRAVLRRVARLGGEDPDERVRQRALDVLQRMEEQDRKRAPEHDLLAPDRTAPQRAGERR